MPLLSSFIVRTGKELMGLLDIHPYFILMDIIMHAEAVVTENNISLNVRVIERRRLSPQEEVSMYLKGNPSTYVEKKGFQTVNKLPL